MSAESRLKQEIAALQHELRRASEALERNRSRQLERRAQQLRDNIALCERDLKQTSQKSGILLSVT